MYRTGDFVLGKVDLISAATEDSLVFLAMSLETSHSLGQLMSWYL